MDNSMLTIAYGIYLPVTILLTLYVARKLFKNALVFMRDIFHSNEEIAVASNKLFEIGFYLMNIGFALIIMKISTYGDEMNTSQELIEILSKKIGAFSIYLGFILFLNLYFFFKERRKSLTPPELNEEKLIY